jgi:hypothetical protein
MRLFATANKLVELNFCSGRTSFADAFAFYLDRSKVTILRVNPLSAQFGITRQGVNTISRSPASKKHIKSLFSLINRFLADGVARWCIVCARSPRTNAAECYQSSFAGRGRPLI